MDERLLFQELESQNVSSRLRADLITIREEVGNVLRPRLPAIAVDGNLIRFQSLVGSVRLPSGVIVEVSPKLAVAAEWTRAVVQLLEPETRIAVTGSQRSRASTPANDLSSALALEYRRRLEAALRSEGPLSVYERKHLVSRRLNGHLDVTKWVRSSTLDPTKFPIGKDELTTSNDFTRGLSLVAGWLSRVAIGAETSSSLRRLQAAVLPGHPIPTYVNPAISKRPLPTQWAKYRPAWDIAAPLLRQLSVVGDPGRATGLEIAIEPWPLLETLLARALKALAREDDRWEFIPKGGYPLLRRQDRTALTVIPDGLLRRSGSVAATFECKYTVPGATPSERHVHQALATAAAVGSPLAVLVYPGDQAPQHYGVAGFRGGAPTTLVTIGLSLFSYERAHGDNHRSRLIAQVLATAGNGHGHRQRETAVLHSP
ncbi:5-methylcytosine restriction system specificity protein McrC [Promicromonospora sukumoe]